MDGREKRQGGGSFSGGLGISFSFGVDAGGVPGWMQRDNCKKLDEEKTSDIKYGSTAILD